MSLAEPYTPYCGLKVDDSGRPVRVTTAPHVCASAPTRSGKTRRILGPAAVMHPGPVFSCSSKPDLAQLVIPHRTKGPTGVIDLSPVKTETWPSDVKAMVSDPTTAISNPDEALTVAETMLATSGVGFGGATSGATVSSGGLWESTAAAPLAALLYAASPCGNRQGMPWVLNAAENYGLPDPNDDSGPANIPAESWMKAYQLCPHPLLAEPLLSMLTMDPRMRDSVAITARKAIKPWLRLGLATSARLDTLSAVEQLDVHTFDFSLLDDPDATIFLIAPNHGTVAGVAVALIDSIIEHFRRKAANYQLTHRLLLQLDEVCNAAPLPGLLKYCGESAGLGVNIQMTVQASSHFDVVYGPKYADALRDMIPGWVIMYGAHERHLLEQSSHWLGLATRRTESYEPSGGHRGQSSVFGQEIEWQEFLPQDLTEARVLTRGAAGEKLLIPDFDDFLNIYYQAVSKRLKRIRVP